MEKEGSVVTWRTLDESEYAEELAKKLEEELDELDQEVGQDRLRDLKELADVAEVYETAWEVLDRDDHYELFESATEELEKAIDMWEIDPSELLEAKALKVQKAGSYVGRIFIEKVSVEPGNPWLEHYLTQPDKYPEIR